MGSDVAPADETMHRTVLALAPGRPLPSEALSFGARLGVPFGSRRPDPLRPAVLFLPIPWSRLRRRGSASCFTTTLAG